MTAAQLIALLEECDPDDEVRIMSQEDWPFENAILGVNVRESFAGDCDGMIAKMMTWHSMTPSSSRKDARLVHRECDRK